MNNKFLAQEVVVHTKIF